MDKTTDIAGGHRPENSQPDSFDLADLTKMYDFTGKTVAITGGAGVLGGEIAGALAGCGASVAILDMNAEAGKALIERDSLSQGVVQRAPGAIDGCLAGGPTGQTNREDQRRQTETDKR